MPIAARVAARFRLFRAFTYAEALGIFGYARTDRPSDDEVNKVYRKKIKDLMTKDPDAIRDQQVMKPFNQAKDILVGRLSPDRDPGDFHRPPTGDAGVDDDVGGTGGGGAWTSPKREPDTTVTFDEAKADAGIPSDVKWVFVTDSQRGKADYSSDEFQKSTMGWVACGETDTHWVFVTVQHYYYQAYVIGDTRGKTDVWDMETLKYAKNTPVPTASDLYGNVKKAWKSFKYEMKEFNSKVVDAKGWHFSDRRPTGREITIKQLVSNLTGTEFTGKLKVEILYKGGPWGEQAPAGFYKPQYADPLQFELVINGREYTLEVSDIEKLYKLRVGGKPFAKRVFGDYPEHVSQPKNLTLNRDGKLIMAWMAEKLAHLPEWVREALTKAVDQPKGGAGKRAAYSYDRSCI